MCCLLRVAVCFVGFKSILTIVYAVTKVDVSYTLVVCACVPCICACALVRRKPIHTIVESIAQVLGLNRHPVSTYPGDV
uniref:Uncharacterized protein n=1 Tax=Ciona savignyi TaxID=51511 RepID=H2Y778_CIOSA